MGIFNIYIQCNLNYEHDFDKFLKYIIGLEVYEALQYITQHVIWDLYSSFTYGDWMQNYIVWSVWWREHASRWNAPVFLSRLPSDHTWWKKPRIHHTRAFFWERRRTCFTQVNVDSGPMYSQQPFLVNADVDWYLRNPLDLGTGNCHCSSETFSQDPHTLETNFCKCRFPSMDLPTPKKRQ